MIIPLTLLALIAVAITRYAIGFACGRVYRAFGPLTWPNLAMIATIWTGIFGLYLALGHALTV